MDVKGLNLKDELTECVKNNLRITSELFNIVQRIGQMEPDANKFDELLSNIFERTDQLLETNASLKTLLDAGRKHQAIYEEIKSVEKELQEINEETVSFFRDLTTKDNELDIWLHKANKHERSIIRQENLDIDLIISYSKRISGTTQAPSMWQPGEPLGLYRPPNPQEDLMRSSKLFQLGNVVHVAKSSEEVNDNTAADTGTATKTHISSLFRGGKSSDASEELSFLLDL